MNGIEVIDHTTNEIEEIPIASASGGHGGGDDGAIRRFLAAVRGEEEPGSTIHEALEAHLYAFAAEEARLSGETIDLGSYRERLVSPEK